MKINIIFLIILISLSPIFSRGMIRLYHEKTESRITSHHFMIKAIPSGYLIILESKNNSEVISQEFKVDQQLTTTSWIFSHPEENTRISAYREKNQIFLSGSSKGKTINKTFKINSLAWNQTFNLGLEAFSISSENSLKFWSIGTKGPGNMKITRFKVKKKGIETINIQGKEVISVHITISLTGILSVFWTGHYWYRQSDGQFLRYKGRNSPGAPTTIMELVSE